MEIFGRLTADATVKTVKDEKQVVNFSIAINDNYKTRDTGEVKKLVTFVNCSFWRSAKIASLLTKGTMIELSGRMSVNAWISGNNEARAALVFHVSNIKFHGRSNNSKQANNTKSTPIDDANPDDLPF